MRNIFNPSNVAGNTTFAMIGLACTVKDWRMVEHTAKKEGVATGACWDAWALNNQKTVDADLYTYAAQSGSKKACEKVARSLSAWADLEDVQNILKGFCVNPYGYMFAQEAIKWMTDNQYNSRAFATIKNIAPDVPLSHLGKLVASVLGDNPSLQYVHDWGDTFVYSLLERKHFGRASACLEALLPRGWAELTSFKVASTDELVWMKEHHLDFGWDVEKWERFVVNAALHVDFIMGSYISVEQLEDEMRALHLKGKLVPLLHDQRLDTRLELVHHFTSWYEKALFPILDDQTIKELSRTPQFEKNAILRNIVERIEERERLEEATTGKGVVGVSKKM